MKIVIGSTVGRWAINGGLIGILCMLNACGGNIQPQTVNLVSAEEKAAMAREAAALKKQQQRDARVERLIEQAGAALLNGRLTLPEHDNAYDRFSAVLMLEAKNEHAQRGIHRILLAYVARVHQALARGRLSRAAALLGRVKLYYPSNPLVLGLSSKVTKAQQAFAAVGAKKEQLEVDSGRRVPLPSSELSEKGTAIELILTEIAQRVKDSDESVMIHARTDAEGRWVYRTMKRAAGDYRIRGDIRIHRQPAIVFMAPLEEDESLSEY